MKFHCVVALLATMANAHCKWRETAFILFRIPADQEWFCRLANSLT